MPAQLNDHDLLVRIDARTEALQEHVSEMKETLTTKADADRVARLEGRMDKSDDNQKQADKKLNYICGGLIALQALLKVTGH